MEVGYARQTGAEKLGSSALAITYAFFAVRSWRDRKHCLQEKQNQQCEEEDSSEDSVVISLTHVEGQRER